MPTGDPGCQSEAVAVMIIDQSINHLQNAELIIKEPTGFSMRKSGSEKYWKSLKKRREV